MKNKKKYDIILMNPPYKKSLHLDFFNKGLDLLAETGKMVIIEPSTWLIDLRQNIAEKKSSQMKKYITLKERIKGHLNKIIIENYNKEFNVGLYVPYSITYIDNAKTFDEIEFINYGVKKYVNSLDNCNLIGNNDLIKSIFDKIKFYDKIKNHICNKIINKDIYYCKYSDILSVIGCVMSGKTTGSLPKVMYNSNTYWRLTKNGSIINGYISSLYHTGDDNYISNTIHHAKKPGASKEYKNIPTCNIYGTKEELENWKYYVFNNSLPLFINICMTIDQHNNSLPYVPWIVDKKYTNEEIYKLFNFTKDEIELIENTIKRYERNSPWFKRYMCGPSSASDEEVQKFIDELENEKIKGIKKSKNR